MKELYRGCLLAAAMLVLCMAAAGLYLGWLLSRLEELAQPDHQDYRKWPGTGRVV
jgi:hypothetical protein